MLQHVDLADVIKLNAVIKQVYKVDFSSLALDSYRRRVYSAMNVCGASTIEDFSVRIANDQEVFNKFCTSIRVDVTEFFRDPSFWKQFREQVSSKLLTHLTIRIWVPNFSSGQELMTLLICLRELGAIDKCKILATDISEELIERVKSSVFSIKEIELAQSNYDRYGGKNGLSSYYTIVNDLAHFDQSLLRNVQFKKYFLGFEASPGKFDLILCRNTMIYFNHKLKDTVLSVFAESTMKGGFLAIGIKESLEKSSVEKEYNQYCIDEKIYQKL